MGMRWGSAAEAGFDPERLERAFAVVAERTGGPQVPGAVAAVGRGGTGVGPRAFGWAVYAPEGERVAAAPDTLFDLASLTKVVGTATAVWLLIEDGRVSLGDRFADLLPAFAPVPGGEPAGWRREVTLRHLLTHTAGLPAGRALAQVPGGRAERLAATAATPLEARPGERCVYSDLGFILLGWLVEEISGETEDAFCRRRVFAPLGMVSTGWCPAPELAQSAAATEWVQADGHAGYLRGRVHDENARSLAGLAGHAGLFAPAADMAVFADTLCAGGIGGAPGRPPERLLSAAAVRRFGTAVVIGEESSRTLGWQAPGRAGVLYGDLWTDRAFGHTGFTGTSLWIDPGQDVWMVLLTNAVHMGRAVGLPAMGRLRTYFHNAVMAALV